MSVLDKIRSGLALRGLDAVMLRDEHNRFYVTGFRSSYGLIIVTKDEAFFLIDGRYIEAARQAVEGCTIGLVGTEMGEKAWVEQIAKDCGIRKMGVEEATTTLELYRRMERWGFFELCESGGIVTGLREGKTEREAASIRAAQVITEKVFDEMLGIISPGMTERELAAEIVYRLLRHGAERVSFDPIVVAGANSSKPHGEPGDYRVQAGDFVTMDFGCIKYGYCSDMTRTVALGGVTDEMRRVYDIVLRAQDAGIAAAHPGAKGKDIDAAARKVIEDAGYGKCFGHSFGHSLGLEVHEAPNASPTEERVMPEGAVISAEPGIYIEGRFGVRIEDMLYLTGNGCKNLTTASKELLII